MGDEEAEPVKETKPAEAEQARITEIDDVTTAETRTKTQVNKTKISRKKVPQKITQKFLLLSGRYRVGTGGRSNFDVIVLIVNEKKNKISLVDRDQRF